MKWGSQILENIIRDIVADSTETRQALFNINLHYGKWFLMNVYRNGDFLAGQISRPEHTQSYSLSEKRKTQPTEGLVPGDFSEESLCITSHKFLEHSFGWFESVIKDVLESDNYVDPCNKIGFYDPKDIETVFKEEEEKYQVINFVETPLIRFEFPGRLSSYNDKKRQKMNPRLMTKGSFNHIVHTNWKLVKMVKGYADVTQKMMESINYHEKEIKELIDATNKNVDKKAIWDLYFRAR